MRSLVLLSIMLNFIISGAVYGSTPEIFKPTRIDEAPKIDGVLDEEIWSKAFEVRDLAIIEPYNNKKPTFQTRFKFAYDNKALYIGAINEQPEATHIRRISARDKELERDDIKIVLDPSGLGRYGYVFELALGGSLRDGTLRPEREYSYDWDGPWEGATSSDKDHWYAEMKIPWNMMALPEKEGKRRLGIFLQRRVSRLGEYWAIPAIPFSSSVYLSAFAPMEVDKVNPRGRLTFCPYVSLEFDNVTADKDLSIGTDIFWQPFSNLLVSTTINPDFGQVENDEVEVNFSATETLLQEKRPFFVEGNDIFETNGLHLVHTRRIGDLPDVPELAVGESITKAPPLSDILAAVKITGQKKNLRYGFMSAIEDNSDYTINGNREITVDGRDFYAVRALYDHSAAEGGNAALGYLATLTRHGSYDAWVHSLDGQWLTGDKRLRLESQIASSYVREKPGYAWNGKVTYSPKTGTEYRAELDYADDSFEINDMGYLERNDRLKFEAGYRTHHYDLPGFKRLSWEFEAHGEANRHLLDAKIGGHIFVILHNLTKFFTELYYIPGTWDDLSSYGNGEYRKKEGFLAYISWMSNSSKPVRVYINSLIYTGHNGGIIKRFTTRLGFDLLDVWQIDLELNYYDREDWILWQEDNRMNGFDGDQLGIDLNSNFQISGNQELRLALQWVGIDAVGKTAYRISTDGYLEESGEDARIRSFDYAELAFQVRYKYEIAPLSDLYIVYTRGNILLNYGDDRKENFWDIWEDSLEDKDTDRFVVKVRYRF